MTRRGKEENGKAVPIEPARWIVERGGNPNPTKVSGSTQEATDGNVIYAGRTAAPVIPQCIDRMTFHQQQ